MPNLNIRVKEGYLDYIDEAAKKYGLNRTEFVINAINMLAGFDEMLLERINGYSEVLNSPPWVVIQNMLIRRLAESTARVEVWGYGAASILTEFKMKSTADNLILITGEELYQLLYEDFKDEFTQSRIDHLLKLEMDGPLTGEDRLFMIRHEAGQTWAESQEFKDLQEFWQRRQAEAERLRAENDLKNEGRWDDGAGR